MKKRIVFVSSLIVALSVCACGSSTSSPESYLSGLTASDYVELCDYSEIPVETQIAEITEEDVMDAIETALESYVSYEEVTDRAVQEGDIVNIDYVGYLDGAEESFSSDEGYDLEIGSDTFVDGFEDGLIGCEIGGPVSVGLFFPDDYYEEDYAGLYAVFEVTINSIQEPVAQEYNDEWVASLAYDGVSTTEEYEEYVYSVLYESAVEEYTESVQSEALEYLEENSTLIADLPEKMVKRIFNDMVEYYEYCAEYYGYDYEDFLVTYLYADESDPEAVVQSDAELYVYEMLIMQAIADEEDLNPTDEELEEYYAEYAELYGYEDVDEMSEYADMESLAESAMYEKVYDFLATRVVSVSEDEE